MSSRLDLTPADLDRLEDALEDLELSSLDELADDDPVAQRLSEYRELLVLGRQALPLEEVPAGLLDGVLAEARQAAAARPAADAAKPSFWARWRLGTWVPALAFAGSAALLLVMLVPERSSEPEESTVAQSPSKRDEAKAEAAAGFDAKSDGRLAYAEPPSPPDDALLEGEAQRSEGVAIGERAPMPGAVPAPAPVEELADADEPEAEESAASAPLRRKAASASSPGAAAGGKPAPKAPATTGGSSKGKTNANAWPDPLGGADTGAKKDEPKEQKPADGSWSEIERADADRRGGSCGLAKMRYDKLRKSDDARVRARALAGAGLCAAASDDMATAKKLFAQARAADPGVSGFIDRELATSNALDPAPAE